MPNKSIKTLSPKIDVVFQALFGEKGNERITKGFLEKILDRKINKIDLDKNPILRREFKDEKLGVLDILAELDGKEKCNIELQIVDRKNIIERILFYWSRLYSRQIKAGKDYKELEKTIVIVITDFRIENLEELGYHSTWQIMETKSTKKIILTKKLEIDIIELPKIEGKEKVKDELLDWLYFLEEPKGERVTKNMEENEELKEAVEKLDSLSADERMQRIADLREKAIMDEKAIYDRGEEIGVRKIAKLMLKVDMEIEQIKEITGLTEEEIEKIDDLSKEERQQRMEKIREKAIMDEKAIYDRGEEIGVRKIAKLMLKVDMEIEQIKEITGLTEEEIEKIDDLSKEERQQRMEKIREKAIMDEKAIYDRGEEIGVIKMAKGMLNENISIDVISRITGLNEKEIQKIKKHLSKK